MMEMQSTILGSRDSNQMGNPLKLRQKFSRQVVSIPYSILHSISCGLPATWFWQWSGCRFVHGRILDCSDAASFVDAEKWCEGVILKSQTASPASSVL
jgi:hypothetical protein